MSALPAPRRTTAIIAEEMRREVDAAEADFQSGVQHAIRAGELLIEAKEQLRHGEWLPWLAENFPGTPRTAQHYMRFAEKRDAVSHLASIRDAIAALVDPKPEPKPEPEVEFVVVRGRPFGSGIDGNARRFGIPARDDRLATLRERDPVRGLFAWMGPWRATCPCCGDYEVHPRPIEGDDGAES